MAGNTGLRTSCCLLAQQLLLCSLLIPSQTSGLLLGSNLIVQEGYDGGLDQVEEMWEAVEHNHIVEPVRFTDGFAMGWKEREESNIPPKMLAKATEEQSFY